VDPLISDCSFFDNRADSGAAGALLATSFTNLTVGRSTFYANIATTGGAIAIQAPQLGSPLNNVLQLRESTLNSNQAGGAGGAVYVNSGSGGGSSLSSLSVAFVTFADNTAASGASAIQADGSAQVSSSIFVCPGAPGQPCVAAGPSGSAQLSRCILPGGFGVPGDGNIDESDPMLGALIDNGGATLSMLPQPGSPAIDAGSALALNGDAVDQRGSPRTVCAAPDIGAVESALMAA
jgi:hypothetical protein